MATGRGREGVVRVLDGKVGGWAAGESALLGRLTGGLATDREG
jgi:hypothetical protein